MAELGRELYRMFPAIRANIDYAHGGGAMLNAVVGERVFVFEYAPEQGYGVTPDPEPFAVGSKYQFDNFNDARTRLIELLRQGQAEAERKQVVQ